MATKAETQKPDSIDSAAPERDAAAGAATIEALMAAEPELVEATRLAWLWHGRQTRKGRPTSYLSHLFAVQGLVVEFGGGPDQTIAALLHDSLEDAETPAVRREREEIIVDRFEPEVLRIVLDCTDTTPEEAGAHKGPWRSRKERYLDQLRHAESASLLVAACDKLHNLGDLVRDLRHEGPATLDRFNAGAVEQTWYFETLASLFRPLVPRGLTREIDDLLEEFRRLCG